MTQNFLGFIAYVVVLQNELINMKTQIEAKVVNEQRAETAIMLPDC